MYEKGAFRKKTHTILTGLIRRTGLFFRLSNFDYVFIHRELVPFGPPVLEWVIAKVFKKKIIYDIDDAIWLADQNKETPFWKWLKWRSKVKQICKWSWKVTAGNGYLADFARHYCDRVIVFPTVVDTDIHTPFSSLQKGENKVVIGWTGSHSTLFYLDQIVPVLQDLERQYNFAFVVIANRDPKLPLRDFRFIPWSMATEIEDLNQIDIGIMPLEDNEWAKGKCGFKLIQYLALEIPAIASPVGVNEKVIQHGESGFLASNHDEWKKYLILLMKNQQLRNLLGKNGRKFIEENYSVYSQKEKFLKLFG